MKYKTIIFDLDGTLSDSLEDIADSLNLVFKNQSLPTHTISHYKQLVGNGLRKLVKDALPEEHRERPMYTDCLNAFLKKYESNCLIKTKPYKGVVDMLNQLDSKGISYSILSNKVDLLTKKIATTIFPNNKFEFVVGVKNEADKKPNPQSALTISQNLGLKPEEVIFVGDGAVDMQTAKNANMFAVGALWGFKTQEELVQGGADCLIEYPSDLIELF